MRAIILAAGMGTRLRPLTNDTPKSLIKVNGEPMAERQIRFLKEKGIDDIIVVTGYLPEKFEYLKEKYGVKIVHNDKYDVYNNVYTMYLVRDYLKDAYVTEADVYMVRNYFEEDIKESTYFGAHKENFENEWMLVFNEENKVEEIQVCSGNGYIMSGVSYWTEKDGEFIKGRLEEAINSGDFKNLYWDDIVKNNLQSLNIHIRKISGGDCFEIDSVEDLKKAEEFLKR